MEHDRTPEAPRVVGWVVRTTPTNSGAATLRIEALPLYGGGKAWVEVTTAS